MGAWPIEKRVDVENGEVLHINIAGSLAYNVQVWIEAGNVEWEVWDAINEKVIDANSYPADSELDDVKLDRDVERIVSDELLAENQKLQAERREYLKRRFNG
jgi:hypothetical protein